MVKTKLNKLFFIHKVACVVLGFLVAGLLLVVPSGIELTDWDVHVLLGASELLLIVYAAMLISRWAWRAEFKRLTGYTPDTVCEFFVSTRLAGKPPAMTTLQLILQAKNDIQKSEPQDSITLRRMQQVQNFLTLHYEGKGDALDALNKTDCGTLCGVVRTLVVSAEGDARNHKLSMKRAFYDTVRAVWDHERKINGPKANVVGIYRQWTWQEINERACKL